MASRSNSLFSWPSNASLTAFHLLARVTLVLANTVGLSVSYAAGATSAKASFWIAAVFMSASLVIFQPIFIVWNKKQLKRSYMIMFDTETQPESRSAGARPKTQPVSTRFLEFAIAMDTIGVLGYWITWGFTIHDSVGNYNRYWFAYEVSIVALMTYAGAATLACALIHSVLIVTQVLQLRSAYRLRSVGPKVCPNCNHSLNEMTGGGQGTGAGRASRTAAPSDASQESQNLLGHDEYTDTDPDAQTVIDMSPGQETGTCAITPRVSTSSGLRTEDTGVANEDGTCEGDRLIEKIASDLQATTQSGWLARVMPNLA